MDDNTFGKVLFVGLVALVIWGITALLKANGEGARRARLVLGGALALVVAWVVFLMVGPVGFTIALVVIGAITWVVKGARK